MACLSITFYALAHFALKRKRRESQKQVLELAITKVRKGEDVPKSILRRLPAADVVRSFVEDALAQPAARQRGLFQHDYLAELMSDPKQHITPLRGSKVWQIALLELWFQQHKI